MVVDFNSEKKMKKEEEKNTGVRYPLNIDNASYEALKTICEIKKISIKDGLRNAISLLIADNLSIITISSIEKK